ncbi:protein phosphatase 2C domain-containing protein [Micromonospora sp. WMMD882]|uniref:protein phosphatase 2C domain-containing protein n=1 Tax=Micromonospora sp. WMMD882 TaxID=3015151 RepID=UPI00248C3482|nr:protein phosphatase 2C domain-containing protein [Micromonospora sp. WMMD882]WBB77772.1 protein phosphatase 2C domain-containing protein [Micromonospora sp. WMMD882]
MDAGVFPPGWRIVPASVTGPDHVELGVENQDAVGYRRLGRGFLLAVADGAGSSRHAATAARLAVDAARDAADLFGSDLAEPAAFARVGRRFADACLGLFDRRVAALVAAGAGDGVADWATTLLTVVAQPPLYYYVGVGDAFLVFGRRGGGAHLVLPPDPDADAGATVFLTSAARDDVVRQGLVVDPAVTGVALCTDGLAEAALTTRREPDGRRRHRAPADFAGYFAVFADPGSDAAELGRRLSGPELAVTSGDDKTMLLAVRR